MRWTTKEYERGDKRVRKAFLFFPMKLYNEKLYEDETRWLEIASWVEEYEYSSYLMSFYWNKLHWKD